MDNTYFGWDYDQIKNNLMNHIIPFIEATISVSTLSAMIVHSVDYLWVVYNNVHLYDLSR